MQTLRAKLVASQTDCLGYTNYVFENLEFQDYDYKYIMCVQFPNWNQPIINNNEIGFVTIKHVRGGIDEWYNGSEFIKYNYTNIIFIKFIKDKPEISEILVD